jgi:iron(III) transport system ATP-binding protein
MSTAQMSNLGKQFGQQVALDSVNLEIRNQEALVLLGPSGCGKTTLLRAIAGLERPDAGQIIIQEQVVFSKQKSIFVPPHRRRVGMVFQNYALWPHMNLLGNVSYPLRMKKLRAKSIQEQVSAMIKLVQLDGLERRYPHELSGGQQQRAALARALVMNPDLLLLDEPLSSLDAILAEEMRGEIRRIHDETRLSMLYVTHDQTEAMALASRIGVMDSGRLVQLGPALEVYSNPSSKFVAEFTGASNIIAGIISIKEGQTLLQLPGGGHLLLPDELPLMPGPGVFAIRPEDIWIHQEKPGILAMVESSTHLGRTIEYHLRIKDICLRARTFPNHMYEAGQPVYIGINHITALRHTYRHRHRKGCKGHFA